MLIFISVFVISLAGFGVMLYIRKENENSGIWGQCALFYIVTRFFPFIIARNLNIRFAAAIAVDLCVIAVLYIMLRKNKFNFRRWLFVYLFHPGLLLALIKTDFIYIGIMLLLFVSLLLFCKIFIPNVSFFSRRREIFMQFGFSISSFFMLFVQEECEKYISSIELSCPQWLIITRILAALGMLICGSVFIAFLIKLKSGKTPFYFLFAAALLFMIVGSYIGYRLALPQERTIRCIMILFICAIVLWGTVLAIQNKLTVKWWVILLLLCGVILRIGYMLYTPCDIRNHDAGELSVLSRGHGSYLLIMIKEHRLPMDNDWQHYQQPFYYMLGSLFSAAINRILGNCEDFYLVDAAKTVSAYASGLFLLLIPKIGKILSLKEDEVAAALAFCAFSPVFILNCANTPDSLAAFMILLAFTVTLIWEQNPGWKNTVFLAVIYGFCLLTKTSAAVIAIFTFVIFIKQFIKEIKEKRVGKIFIKYMVFLCISVPIGFSYSIRNSILFGQRIGYVPIPGLTNGNLYVGDESAIKRFWSIDFAGLFQYPYVNVYSDVNEPVYFLKSSLFGEYTWNLPIIFGYMLLLSSFVIVILLMVSIIEKIIRKKVTMKVGYLYIALVIQMIFYYLFQIKMPYACSMDARYFAMPIALCGFFYGMRGEWCFCSILKKVCLTFFAISAILFYAFPF